MTCTAHLGVWVTFWGQVLSQLYAVSLFWYSDINPHTKLGSFETVWEENRRAYVCACCVCVIVCIFLNQLSFSPVYKAWGLDLVSCLHRREVARSQFPICPSFSFVIPQSSSSNRLSNPQALSFTALQSALSPTPSIYFLFPLTMCLIALLPPPPWWFFFPFSQACLALQHMLHNLPSCCFSFSFSDFFSLFFDFLLIPIQECHLCMSSFCHSHGLQQPFQTQLPF